MLYKRNSIVSATLANDQVVVAIKQRDNVLMTALYDEYSCPLFSYILKILPDNGLAEKVLESVFKKLLYQIDSYNKQQGTIYVWLMNLSRNEAIDLLINSSAISPGLDVNEDNIKPFILRLPLLEKTIAALSYFRGFGITDIAFLLKIPVNLIEIKMEVVSLQMQALTLRTQVA